MIRGNVTYVEIRLYKVGASVRTETRAESHGGGRAILSEIHISRNILIKGVPH